MNVTVVHGATSFDGFDPNFMSLYEQMLPLAYLCDILPDLFY